MEPLLTVSEVARLLRVSRSMAYQLVARGDIPSVAIGRRCVRVRREDLARFVVERRRPME